MHRSEEEALARCADCGADIDPALERGFSFAGGVLCYPCAERRGGGYDELEDRWSVEPQLTGLPGEPD